MSTASIITVLCIGLTSAVIPNCIHPDTGEIIQNDATFTLEQSGPCITYKCTNGGYGPSAIACKKLNGDCTPLGESIVDGCRTKQCQINQGMVGFVTTKDDCGTGGSTGSVFPNCKYPDTGEIIQNGTTFYLKMSGNCIEYTCKNSGYGASKSECEDSTTGKCVPLGESVVDNCMTKQCTQSDQGIGFQFTDIKCQGDNNQCYSPGDVFTKTYNNIQWNKTTCTVSGNTVRYTYRM